MENESKNLKALQIRAKSSPNFPALTLTKAIDILSEASTYRPSWKRETFASVWSEKALRVQPEAGFSYSYLLRLSKNAAASLKLLNET